MLIHQLETSVVKNVWLLFEYVATMLALSCWRELEGVHLRSVIKDCF